jgi:hypothetical protein
MRRITAIAMVVLATGLSGAAFGASSASAAETVLVDTLGIATPATTFSVFGSSGQVVFETQIAGPRFTLLETTVIIEIGAFINNCEAIIEGVPQCPDTLPITVQIRPSVNGAPDPYTIIATFELSHDDDPLVVSYESAAPNLELGAGEYFALFAPQQGDVGFVLAGASDPFEYRARLTMIGTVDPTTGASSTTEAFAAVRILGHAGPAASLIDQLVDDVAEAGVEPAQRLERILAAAKDALVRDNVSATCGLLAAFANEIEALRGGAISEEDASALIEQTASVEAILGC